VSAAGEFLSLGICSFQFYGKCPICGTSQKQKRSILQKITGLGRSKTRTRELPAKIYENSKFAVTGTSLTSTIRRISAPERQAVPPIPPILKLDISVQTDTRNIDAEQGGECTVLCKLRANYTEAPPAKRATGLDGVILFHTTLSQRNLALAMEVATGIIDACGPQDRLGLLIFGERVSILAEMKICDAEYKRTLVRSVFQIEGSESEGINEIRDGMKLALRALQNDSRRGGHIFVITSGNFPFSPFPSDHSAATLHAIGVGPLTYATNLRTILHNCGTHLEFRGEQDLPDITNLINCLASYAPSPPLPTIQLRLEHPEEIKIRSLQPTQLNYSELEESLTISSPSSLLLTQSISAHSARSPSSSPFQLFLFLNPQRQVQQISHLVGPLPISRLSSAH
jgi:hypothetical protein